MEERLFIVRIHNCYHVILCFWLCICRALSGRLRVNILRVVPAIPVVHVFLAANRPTTKRAKLQAFFIFKKVVMDNTA